MMGRGVRLPIMPPSCWLQRRQSIRVLVMVSCPPCACGSTWSTSALLGLPEYCQSRRTLQRGQLVTPCSMAWALAWSRTRIHLAVPVREDAITILARAASVNL